MAVQNLTASRFILERFLDELEAYDRDIPVASGLSVGEVADALLAFLNNPDIARLSRPRPKGSASAHRGAVIMPKAGGRRRHTLARRAML